RAIETHSARSKVEENINVASGTGPLKSHCELRKPVLNGPVERRQWERSSLPSGTQEKIHVAPAERRFVEPRQNACHGCPISDVDGEATLDSNVANHAKATKKIENKDSVRRKDPPTLSEEAWTIP